MKCFFGSVPVKSLLRVVLSFITAGERPQFPRLPPRRLVVVRHFRSSARSVQASGAQSMMGVHEADGTCSSRFPLHFLPGGYGSKASTMTLVIPRLHSCRKHRRLIRCRGCIDILLACRRAFECSSLVTLATRFLHLRPFADVFPDFLTPRCFTDTEQPLT